MVNQFSLSSVDLRVPRKTSMLYTFCFSHLLSLLIDSLQYVLFTCCCSCLFENVFVAVVFLKVEIQDHSNWLPTDLYQVINVKYVHLWIICPLRIANHKSWRSIYHVIHQPYKLKEGLNFQEIIYHIAGLWHGDFRLLEIYIYIYMFFKVL